MGDTRCARRRKIGQTHHDSVLIAALRRQAATEGACGRREVVCDVKGPEGTVEGAGLGGRGWLRLVVQYVVARVLRVAGRAKQKGGFGEPLGIIAPSLDTDLVSFDKSERPFMLPPNTPTAPNPQLLTVKK